MSMEFLFWASVALLAYIYFGYPAILHVISKVLAKPVRKGDIDLSVTVVIAAHNEAQSIVKTIENKLGSDYPKDLVDIIVVSDGSTDGTDELVASYADRGVKLLRQEPRRGKTAALNLAVSRATGEIIAFSDANSIWEPDALRSLVRNFNDPKVGYVTGKMIYVNPGGSIIGDGCTTYMRYENLLRVRETAVGSVVGVDGGVDAVRKSLYRPMRDDQLPDFILPLRVVQQGSRVVYESKAVLREHTLADPQDEYNMRVRVSLRALWSLWDMKCLLNPFRYPLFSWQLFSHKVLRYAAFIFMATLYIANAKLWTVGSLFRFTFLLQVAFYALAIIGILTGQRGGFLGRLTYVPHYFTLLNLSSAHAFLKFLRGKRQVVWQPRTG